MFFFVYYYFASWSHILAFIHTFLCILPLEFMVENFQTCRTPKRMSSAEEIRPVLQVMRAIITLSPHRSKFSNFDYNSVTIHGAKVIHCFTEESQLLKQQFPVTKLVWLSGVTSETEVFPENACA